MELLSQEEIDKALAANLTRWKQEGDELVLELERPTFLDVISMVQKIAEIAEIADHHPDIDIRFNRLKLALSTHSEGGLTAKDLEVAGQIDFLVAEAEEQAGPPAG